MPGMFKFLSAFAIVSLLALSAQTASATSDPALVNKNHPRLSGAAYKINAAGNQLAVFGQFDRKSKKCKQVKLAVALPDYCSANTATEGSSSSAASQPGDGGYVDITFNEIDSSNCGGIKHVTFSAQITKLSAAKIVAYNLTDKELLSKYLGKLMGAQAALCALNVRLNGETDKNRIEVDCGDVSFFASNEFGLWLSEEGGLPADQTTIFDNALLVCVK